MAQKLKPDEEGATMIEYALVLTLITLISIAPLKSLTTDLVDAFVNIIQNYNS